MTAQLAAPAEAPPIIEIIHDAATVQTAIGQLASRVVERYAGTDTLFISLLDGGPEFSTPLMMEAHRLDPDFHPEVAYIDTDKYGDDRIGKEVRITRGLPDDVRVKGRLAVILDEVLDSADTTEKVEEYLLGLGAVGVEVVVLAQKERRRRVWQEATIHGLTTPNGWLVGMGMNGAPGMVPEAYRFADYIGMVKGSERPFDSVDN